MRDPHAPVINGHDFSGLTNKYSFQCEPYYEEGGNGGTFLDGSTVKDVLAVKERLSWTMNSMTSRQYADMCAAFNSGETPDLSVVVFKDPAMNAVRKAAFHVVTRPPFLFSKEEPYYCTKAGAALVLEESYPIERYAVTPPTQTDYFVGDSFAFALAGMSVTAYDAADEPTDITSLCVLDPPDGSEAESVGSVRVRVSYAGVEIGAFSVNVAELSVVASGDWWTLFNSGTLRVFCAGDMPHGIPYHWPWEAQRALVRTVIIGEGVTNIGYEAFQDCSALTSVTIPDSVTLIGNKAFQRCSALTSVTIPDSVTLIGNNAFQDCSALTSVMIPNSVTSIGDNAFQDCSSLTSVTIPNGVTLIPDEAFKGCSSLTSVTIPDGVTGIGDEAFYRCSSLTSVTIPNGVTVIAFEVFYRCLALASVVIPDSVTSIYDGAFDDCDALTDVYYSGTQAQWEAIDISSRNNDGLSNAVIHYGSEAS